MTDEDPSISGNTNNNGLKIILPIYDGSTDPKSWLRQLEKIKKAPLLLKDRADDYWETIENVVENWNTFKEKFSQEFGERKTVGEHLH